MAAPLIDKIKTIIELSKDPALLRVLLSLKHSQYLVDVGWINSFKSKSMSIAIIYPRIMSAKPKSALRNTAPTLKKIVPNRVSCSDSSGGSICKSAIYVPFDYSVLLKK